MKMHRKYSRLIKAEAHRLGFEDCGIAPAAYLEDHASFLKTWLERGMHGDMDYMSKHFEKRTNPSRLVEGTKSIISVILSYNTTERQADKSAPVLSKYAYGKDYHKVIRKKLKKLLKYIQINIHPVNGRVFTDSAPVLDRAWAAKAGLGWIGKNSNLISPKHGSFVFIGSAFIDLELSYDFPLKDMCGGCIKCITACPVQAIIEPGVVDGSKCISYFTIEYKSHLPGLLKEQFQNRMFGCDICQDVCPWNRKVPLHKTPEFEPGPEIMKMSRDEWIHLDEEKYNRLFEGSAVKRAGYKGLKRNIGFVTGETFH